MIRKILVLWTFIFCSSCSFFEQSNSHYLTRKIASEVPYDEIDVAVEDDFYQVSGTVRVYGKRFGYSEFNFPLFKMESPYYQPIPYFIILNNKDVKCSHSNNISKEVDNLHFYKINEYEFGDYLKCKYEIKGEGFFNFTYRIPKIKEFEVSEASYMKGFYPDIISNMELTLARIYEKLVPKDGKKSERLYYRERELLLKYVPEIATVEFDPKKKEIQFSTKLKDQDLFVISNIEGEIIHPQMGKTSYTGFETDDFKKYNSAGSKYLRTNTVKPFALFCEAQGVSYDFEYANELTLSDPGQIGCSINSRKQGFLGFRTVKGKIKAEVRIMRIEKAIKNLPKYILNKAKTAIAQEILKMNSKNLKTFTKGITAKIDAHEKNIVDMLIVDKSFPYNINVTVETTSVQMFNKPYVRHEDSADHGQDFLSYKIYYKKNFKDENGNPFMSSDIYLGKIHTNLQLDKTKKLSKFATEYQLKLHDFNHFTLFLKDYLDKKDKIIALTTFGKKLNTLAKSFNQLDAFKDVKKVELSRFGLYVCGQVEPYGNEQYEKMVLTELKARYDLFEGGNVNSLRMMSAQNFYSKKIELESPIEIKTTIKFNDKQQHLEQCFYIDPGQFAQQDFRNSVFFKNI